MSRAVDARAEADSGRDPLPVQERPVLRFTRYAVGLHFVVWPQEATRLPRSSEEFSSFERDLLLHVYRATPPLGSRIIPVPDGLRSVEICYPDRLTYVSEGLTTDLICADQDAGGRRRRALRLNASRTDFRSGLAVYHLIFSPDHASDKTGLNEYDFVKLAKLWEGGEGVGPESPHRIDGHLIFYPTGGKPLSLTDLVPAALGLPPTDAPSPRLGTIQLLTSGGSLGDSLAWERALQQIQHLKERGGGEATLSDLAADDLLLRTIKGIAGIMQGLLDFDRIEAPELADVFGAVHVTKDLLMGIHKGTMVSVAESDRALDAAPLIGISPYLLAPHSVLAHNEEWLRRAAEAADRAGSGKVRVLDAARREMHQALDRHYLPNVFHYPTERMLYELGTASRGLNDQERDLRAGLAEVTSELEAKIAKRMRTAEDVIAGLLLVLSAGSLAAIVPFAITIPLLSVAALAYIVWRWRM